TALLRTAGAEQPVLAVIDDAQWLDRASLQALAFAARRITETNVALIIATREPVRELSGMPDLVVAALEQRDARALLDSGLAAPIDERVLDRIVLETGGNP